MSDHTQSHAPASEGSSSEAVHDVLPPEGGQLLGSNQPKQVYGPDPRERVPVFNTADGQKLAGNAAPCARAVHSYLKDHPGYILYEGQPTRRSRPTTRAERRNCTNMNGPRVPIWNRRLQKKVVGNAAPLRKNLKRYLESHEDCEVYAFQDRPLYEPNPAPPAAPSVEHPSPPAHSATSASTRSQGHAPNISSTASSSSSGIIAVGSIEQAGTHANASPSANVALHFSTPDSGVGNRALGGQAAGSSKSDPMTEGVNSGGFTETRKHEPHTKGSEGAWQIGGEDVAQNPIPRSRDGDSIGCRLDPLPNNELTSTTQEHGLNIVLRNAIPDGAFMEPEGDGEEWKNYLVCDGSEDESDATAHRTPPDAKLPLTTAESNTCDQPNSVDGRAEADCVEHDDSRTRPVEVSSEHINLPAPYADANNSLGDDLNLLGFLDIRGEVTEQAGSAFPTDELPNLTGWNQSNEDFQSDTEKESFWPGFHNGEDS